MLGNGRVQTSSPSRPRTGRPAVVEHVDRHAEPARLQLAAPDRPDRVAQREAGDDVGAAADAGEVHVALDRRVDVVVAVLGQRASGREDGLQRREVVRPRRLAVPPSPTSARYLALVPKTVTRSAAAMSQRIGAGAERRAVVQHHRGAHGEARHQPVPHHPAAGGEVEDPVVARRGRCAAPAPSDAGAACRRRRAPCTWADPWCPTST